MTRTETTEKFIAIEDAALAHNYHPLDIVLTTGEGAWVTDVDGRRYLDCLAGYSALNFGHRHPRLVAAAQEQLGRITLTSRAFRNDQLGPFAADLAALCGKEAVLPMNSGAEAVETAVKIARRWGYRVKGVDQDRAQIVVMAQNFHGRTTTIVSFSSDAQASEHYGPFTPGFVQVRFGDLEALAAAITADTVAVLIEPIQGEAGVILPPPGYLAAVRDLCTDRRVLLLADEIQSGLARTGRTFACDHDGVVPDVYILGKALGGGILPVSAVVADTAVMDVITPGSHGSTFGGNPLAARVGREVVAMVSEGVFQERAEVLGARLAAGLSTMPGIAGLRCRGLWAGVDVDPELMSGRDLCERLASRHVLAKDTHGSTIRLAPPLVADEDDIDLLLAAMDESLTQGPR